LSLKNHAQNDIETYYNKTVACLGPARNLSLGLKLDYRSTGGSHSQT